MRTEPFGSKTTEGRVLRSVGSKIIKFAAFVLASVLSVSAASATTLTFDDVTTSGTDVDIPSGYDGFDWSSFRIYDKNDLAAEYGGNPTPGYSSGVVSGTNAAYAYNRGTSSFSAASPFTLASAYFTAAWSDGMTITVAGLNGSTVIDSTTFTVNTAGPRLVNFDWTGLTSVQFTESGGTDSRRQLVVDDLDVGTAAAVPEPASWALMISGFGLVGGTLRTSRRSAAFAA